MSDESRRPRLLQPYVLQGFEKRLDTYTGKSALQEATELRAIARSLLAHVRALEQEEGPAK